MLQPAPLKLIPRSPPYNRNYGLTLFAFPPYLTPTALSICPDKAAHPPQVARPKVLSRP